MPGNPNSVRGSRNNMGSNRVTDIFVGGGSKKAGSAPSASISVQQRMGLNHRGYQQPLSVMILPLVSTVCVSRPTGSDVQFNTYWKCNGIPKSS